MTAPDPDFGVLATSRYVPRLRLERSEIHAQHRWMAPGLRALAKGRRAMAHWDEDAVTMAVEAARLVLGPLEPPRLDELTLASTSLPFADRLNAGVVGAALGLPDDVVARDVASSMRGASIELAQSLRHPAGGSRLLVASELRVPRPASTQEMVVGQGAAAALVGSGRPIATWVAGHSSRVDFIDHFRGTGQAHDYAWEERWVREEGYLKLAVQTLQACLQKAQVTAADVACFALPAPLPKVNEAVARKLGIAPEALVPTHHEDVGDLGTAQVLAMLDTAVRSALPGQLILLAAFGNGCDALLLRRTEVPCPGAVPDAGVPETSYLKYLSFSGLLAPEWGMRAEIDSKTALTAAWRDEARVARFEAGRCRHCGAVQFPAGRLCVTPTCRQQDSQHPVSLVDVPARVMSHTSDFLAYTPHPPFQFGHIDFEGGARVLMEFTDTAHGELQVGQPLRMAYRIKEFDARRGFRRYFWKATPVRAAAAAIDTTAAPQR